jgi:hypothetical protein
MKKVLMFEFNSLIDGLTVDRTVAPFDAEVVPVSRKNYNKPLEELLDPWSDVYDEDAENEPYTGAPLGGRMLVFSELDQELNEILAALRANGIGIECLKAVVTEHNREWDAVTLYNELQKERQAMSRRK